MCHIFKLSVILSLACVSRGLDDDGLGSLAKIFSILAGKEECHFICPPNVRAKSNPKHTPSSNGCGSFGIEVDVSKFPGFDDCCDQHDICYDTCNRVRDACDDDFKQCLNQICHHRAILYKQSKKMLRKCEKQADLMHSGTVAMGCPAYLEAQRNACLCDGKQLSVEEMKSNAQIQEEL